MSHGSEFLCGGCGTIFSACCTRKPGKEENGEDIEENLDEEIRPMRQAIIPRKPDASEVEEHRKCNLLYPTARGAHGASWAADSVNSVESMRAEST